MSAKIHETVISQIINTYANNDIEINQADHIKILNPEITKSLIHAIFTTKNTFDFAYFYDVSGPRPVRLKTNTFEFQFLSLEIPEAVNRDFLNNNIINQDFTCQTSVKIKSILPDATEDSEDKKFRLFNIDHKTNFTKYGHGISVDTIFPNLLELTKTQSIQIETAAEIN